VTVLVNNAAKDQQHITEKVTKELWEWSHLIDLKAHFVAWQAVLAGMPAAAAGEKSSKSRRLAICWPK